MRSYSTLAAATSRLRAQTINMRLPAVMAPIKLPMRAGIIAQMRCLRAAPADGPDDRLCVDAGDTDELCNGVLNKMAGVAATPIEEVFVPSQSDSSKSPSEYKVTLRREPDGSIEMVSCECPSFRYIHQKRGTLCKHMQALLDDQGGGRSKALQCRESPPKQGQRQAEALTLTTQTSTPPTHTEPAAASLAATDQHVSTSQRDALIIMQPNMQRDNESGHKGASVPATSTESATSEDLLIHNLMTRFGLSNFQPGQREVVEDLVTGRDCLVLMPTGMGKSLCYQLPAVLASESGVAVVVSPLVSLMKDQVDSLVRLGIKAIFVNSTQTIREQNLAIAAVERGDVELVYVAPERLMQEDSRLLAALHHRTVTVMAVDEAHCISAWGHDFRPSYSQIGRPVKMLRPRVLVALTATATPTVQKDIVLNLWGKTGHRPGRTSPRLHSVPILRTNLFLAAERCATEDRRMERLAECLGAANLHNGGKALVYCGTRGRAERVARELVENPRLASTAGLDQAETGGSRQVVVYHAGLSQRERRVAQESFLEGDATIAVATVAFGMGVDRADVRAVVHVDLPSSVEAYYQEIGRGGRDGLPCTCNLLYSSSDHSQSARLLQISHRNPDRLKIALDRLNYVADYAASGMHGPNNTGNGCRHLSILAYFGDARAVALFNGTPQPPDSEPFVCPGCDVCEDTATRERFGGGKAGPVLAGEDERRTVLIALSGVGRSMATSSHEHPTDGDPGRGMFSMAKLALHLAGSTSKEISRTGLARLSTHGLLRHLKQSGCRELLAELLGVGLLHEQFRRVNKSVYSVVALSRKGRAVLYGYEPLLTWLPERLILEAHQIPDAERARSSGDPVERPTDQLPAGWRRVQDVQGRIYYANDTTGQSQWEPPQCF